MPYTLYYFVNDRGEDEFEAWRVGLEKKVRAKLDQKLDSLEMNGDKLIPNTLTDTPVSDIKKLRVHGNVQLRPLLCKGPIHHEKEYTFLLGAKEKDSKFVPKNALELAEKNKNKVISEPDNRRKKRERIS
ncbi:hypothetical protein [Thiothrix lacustris]|uniref:hypothetical protein n=1 Tax=Thiothrix lacustris TaxID=525917 RepID=UPI0027E5258A|nr:hypothetical protein [Thiothrix lacustris]WMP15654.1 hypothetical protein RCS87_00075 [Thiothrix lacustris]